MEDENGYNVLRAVVILPAQPGQLLLLGGGPPDVVTTMVMIVSGQQKLPYP